MLATDFLNEKNTYKPVPILAMYGPERFFRTEILKRIPGISGDSDEGSLTRLAGATAELRSVLAELRTVSMFGESRILLIEDADPFVSANRAALEKICSVSGTQFAADPRCESLEVHRKAL